VPPLVHDEMNTLRADRNPAFEFCRAAYWIAERDGLPCGRIAGIVNEAHNSKHNSAHARFGWVDFVDDPEVSGALFATVEDWARGQGMTALHGPLGFTDMDHEGTLVEGFDELGTAATIFNHPYYPAHIERLGYRRDADWLEYEVKVPATIPPEAMRVADIVLARRRLHMLEPRSAKDLLPYGKEIFALINDTFADLYGYVALTPRIMDSLVKQYFPHVDPDFVKVILDDQGRVAGAVLAFPSLSRALQQARGRLLPFGWWHILRALKKPRTIDLYLGAIRRDLQGKGADALLITELYRSCVARGIVSAESNPELESNVLVRGHWKHFDHRQHKRRRCYVKDVPPT